MGGPEAAIEADGAHAKPTMSASIARQRKAATLRKPTRRCSIPIATPLHYQQSSYRITTKIGFEQFMPTLCPFKYRSAAWVSDARDLQSPPCQPLAHAEAFQPFLTSVCVGHGGNCVWNVTVEWLGNADCRVGWKHRFRIGFMPSQAAAEPVFSLQKTMIEFPLK